MSAKFSRDADGYVVEMVKLLPETRIPPSVIDSVLDYALVLKNEADSIARKLSE